MATAINHTRPSILKLTGKLLAYTAACFAIFGPLSSLVLWSFAEKWYWPNIFPQEFGPDYWVRAFRGDMMVSLVTGVKIAVFTTVIVVLISVPLAYVLARYNIPCKTIIMMLFLLPQAFPSLPIFANLSVLFYKWDIAGKLPGVLMVHIGAAFIYSIWTMVSVFQSIPKVHTNCKCIFFF
jgi:putative spermidine/putrescine transport system permease protein